MVFKIDSPNLDESPKVEKINSALGDDQSPNMKDTRCVLLNQAKKKTPKVDLPPSKDPSGSPIPGTKDLVRNDLDLNKERAIQANELKPRILQELYDDMSLRIIDIADQPSGAAIPSDERIRSQDYATLMNCIEVLTEI